MIVIDLRASSLMAKLNVESFEELKNGRDWSHVKAGDSVEIKRLPYMTAPAPDKIRGVVIAIANRGVDTSFTLLNVKHTQNIFILNNHIYLMFWN